MMMILVMLSQLEMTHLVENTPKAKISVKLVTVIETPACWGIFGFIHLVYLSNSSFCIDKDHTMLQTLHWKEERIKYFQNNLKCQSHLFMKCRWVARLYFGEIGPTLQVRKVLWCWELNWERLCTDDSDGWTDSWWKLALDFEKTGLRTWPLVPFCLCHCFYIEYGMYFCH